MADPNITANIGSLDALPSGEFQDADLLEVERPVADPAPNDNFRATWGQLKAAIAAEIGSGAQTGDALITARDPGAGWVRQGTVYAQSLYPDLFGLVGLVPDGPAGASWASWAPGALPNTAVNDACWLTDQTAIAVGNNVIWRTTNGGASWSSITVTGNLIGCARVSDTVALAVGGSGVILRSTDAGASWSAVTSGTTSTLRGIIVFSASRVFVAAETNRQNRLTTDGGVTWGAGGDTAASMTVGVRFSSTVAVVLGNSTTAYRTTNGGASWTLVTVPNIGNVTKSIVFNSTTAVAVSSNGTTIRTTDAGATWASVTSGATFVVYSAVLTGPDSGVIVSSGTSAYTLDAGATWTTVSIAATALHAFTLPNGHVIAVGNAAQYRSLPDYGYDFNTQFKTPSLDGLGYGFTGYVKT